jgi:hypothetical protein
LDLLGELVVGQRLGPDALNHARQRVDVDPEARAGSERRAWRARWRG